MNLIESLRPRYRVHLRLLALETTDSPLIEEAEPLETLEGMIAELGEFMGYQGNWRDWDDDRQALVLGAVWGGLDDFDFRELETSTEDNDG